jgi:hypothetical protein
LFGRFMGALILAFIIFMAFDIVHDNGIGIYENLGR